VSAAWRQSPLVAVAAIAVALLAIVFVFRACRTGQPPVGPELAYSCSDCDTTWEQPRSLDASCPSCKARGATRNEAMCQRCKHEFVGWETRQIGVGKFEHRLPGGVWSGLSPATLTCPKCKRQGEFGEGRLFFTPREGWADTPVAEMPLE